MLGKRIAALLVMALVAVMFSGPAMAGSADHRSGNGSSQGPVTVSAAPTLLDSIAAALPAHLGAWVKVAFSPVKNTDETPDLTTSGLGGCRLLVCACGLGGC